MGFPKKIAVLKLNYKAFLDIPKFGIISWEDGILIQGVPDISSYFSI